MTTTKWRHFCNLLKGSAVIVLLSTTIGPSYACMCWPNFADASDVFAIEILAIESSQTAGSELNTAPSVVSYRVTATLRGNPRPDGRLIHTGHHKIFLCGPPMYVGASYIVALSSSTQCEVSACSFERVLRDDQIEATRKFIEIRSK